MGVCIGVLGGWGGGGKKSWSHFWVCGIWKVGGRNTAEKWHRDKIIGQYTVRECVWRVYWELQSGSCPTPGGARVWTGWHRDRKYWGKDRRGGFCSELG